MKKSLLTYLLITVCSVLYGAGVSLFIFPAGIVLGGTGGISVIICRCVPVSAGAVSTVLNGALIIVGFLVLGREMGVRTLWGAATTALFIYIIEIAFEGIMPLTLGPVASAVAGGTIIASATGLLFALGSSSGGTDVIALIVNKKLGASVGGGLLIADVITVTVGGILDGRIAFASAIGFVIKFVGADFVVRFIKGRARSKIAE